MPATLHSIEQKLKSKLPTSTEDKQRLNRACATVVSGLQLTLNIVREATGNIGVPGLQAGISSLLFVVDVIKVKTLIHYHISIAPSNDQAENISKCTGHRATCEAHRQSDNSPSELKECRNTLQSNH
jgi:hypothetical protein